MFTVIASFPAAAAHRDAVFAALDASTKLMSRQPGALGYQVLAPTDDADTKVAIMLWDSEASFRAMLKTPESKAAHAGMSPEMWREAPSIQYFHSESAWHPTPPPA